MGLYTRIFLLVFIGGTVAAVLLGFLYDDAPVFKSSGYWGRKNLKQTQDAPKDNPVIQKFKIHVSNDVLADLKRRLLLSRFTQLLDESPSSLNRQALKDILDYWTNQYDWRVQENQLNQYAHFRTEIEGIQVHFLHSRPKAVDPNSKVYTLLMIHGWPGSPVEFLRMLPLLTRVEHGLAFEVICPSIPGYGFSEVPHKEGFGTTDAARVFVKLMERIQRKQFYVHSGGWGAKIAKQIALHYPERVLGAHFSTADLQPHFLDTLKLAVKSFLVSFLFADGVHPEPTSHPLDGSRWQLPGETGYRLHPTRPDIVGVALLNSPSALVAYLLEKFPAQTLSRSVGVRNAELKAQDLLDDFLTNVMLYWVSNSITTSVKYYKENMGKVLFARPSRARVSVPAGFSLSPEEQISVSRSDVNMEYDNVVTFIEHLKGEPFAAMHEPELLAKDIRDFVATVERGTNTKVYQGPATDFPFTIIDPQAPVVSRCVVEEAERRAEKPPRVRAVPQQRFEPKLVAQKKPRVEKGPVPDQMPRKNVEPSAKSSGAPARNSPPSTPMSREDEKSDPTARPALQQADETPKAEEPQEAPKAQQAAKLGPTKQGAAKNKDKPSVKQEGVLPKQMAQKEEKPQLKTGSPQASNVPEDSAKQAAQADQKKTNVGQNVQRGTETPVNENEELLKHTQSSIKETHQKTSPPLKM